MIDQASFEKAIADASVLSGMLEDLSPENKDKDRRYSSFLLLNEISEKRPELLYNRWDFLAGLLTSGNTNAKYNALHLLANLANVDTENRFDGIFDAYFDLLDDEKTSIAAHIAGCAGKIALARPRLRGKITGRLLNIAREDNDHRRRDLISGYALESLGLYFDVSDDKEQIMEFAKYLSCSDSPKTRKLAKQFLDSHRAVR